MSNYYSKDEITKLFKDEHNKILKTLEEFGEKGTDKIDGLRDEINGTI